MKKTLQADSTTDGLSLELNKLLIKITKSNGISENGIPFLF